MENNCQTSINESIQLYAVPKLHDQIGVKIERLYLFDIIGGGQGYRWCA